MSKLRFEVIHLKEALEFLYDIDERARRKILFNIERARERLDPRLFKKLDEHIWELRTEYNGIQYRLLAFWYKRGDRLAMVITTHGFVKKTDKVPGKEISKANAMRIQFKYDEEA